MLNDLMYGYVPCTVQEHIYVYVYYVDYVQPGSRILYISWNHWLGIM